MRFSRKIFGTAAATAAMTAVVVTWAVAQSPAPRASKAPAKAAAAATASTGVARIAGKPDFSGVWEANNTANWDLLTHQARPMAGQPGITANSVVSAAPVLALGSIGWIPPGQGVVEGDEIPYLPWAAERKKENEEHWLDRDPEVKCFQPGIPRGMYMPYPFQIIESGTKIQMIYEYADAQRTIHLNKMEDYPNTAWMGYSVGHWEGDTLVTEVTDFNDATWFDRSGDFHSDAMTVTERFTPAWRERDPVRGNDYRSAGVFAAVEDQHAAVPASGAKRAAHGVPLRSHGGRVDVWASAQEPVGEALGRRDAERGHHAQDSAGGNSFRSVCFGESANAAHEVGL